MYFEPPRLSAYLQANSPLLGCRFSGNHGPGPLGLEDRATTRSSRTLYLTRSCVLFHMQNNGNQTIPLFDLESLAPPKSTKVIAASKSRAEISPPRTPLPRRSS